MESVFELKNTDFKLQQQIAKLSFECFLDIFLLNKNLIIQIKVKNDLNI